MKTNLPTIPDAVYLVMALVILIASWVLAVVAYPALPEQVPTHFNAAGIADAYNTKSFWTVFLVPVIQLVVTFGLLLIYRKPKYANIPGTLLLELLDEPHRSEVYRLVKRMLAMTLLAIQALFGYLMTAIAASAGAEPVLNPWILLGLVALLIVVSILYSIRSYRLVRRIVRDRQEQKSVDLHDTDKE